MCKGKPEMKRLSTFLVCFQVKESKFILEVKYNINNK